MSIKTKSDVEYHATAIAIGLAGLRLCKDFGINPTELKLFRSYLEETKEFIIPSSAPVDSKDLNDAFQRMKKNVESPNLEDAIKEGEKLYSYLDSIHDNL